MAEKIVKNPSITSGDFAYDTTTGEVSAIAGKVLAGANAKYSFNGTNGISVTNDESKNFTIGLTDSAYGAVQYVTANSGKFVTSGDYISGSKQYALTSGGWKEITASTGSDYTAGIDLKIDENNAISVDTNGNPNNTATNNRNFVEGSWTVANGYNCHAEGAGTSALGYGVHAQGMWTCFSSSKWGDNTHIETDIYWAVGAGATVEGYCNATTSCPMSGTEGNNYGAVHGGILKVIGNGYIEHDLKPDPDAHSHTHHPSDALILYRDGSLSAAGKISAAGIELGAGGTSYQGRSGVNVIDNYIELTQTAYNALTSVSNKVDKPNTSFINQYLALRTDNAGNVSGWVDLKDNFYSKSEAQGTFVATANIDTTTLSGNGKTSKLGVNTDVIQTKLTEEQLTAISDVSSKLDKDDLDDYIPFSAISLPIGTNNDVTDYSMGIGYSNTANYGDVKVAQQVEYGSLAFGYQNSASKMSFAAGNGNKALHVGFAVGYQCSATEHAVAMNNNCGANDYSFAEGNNNKANKYSFAGGLNCIADDYSFAYGEATSAIGKSFAYGPANTAYNYSHLFGRGLEYSGASTSGYNLGAFVIGGWNATTSYATTADAPLFIVGNGNGNGANRSDALVLTRDGKLTTNKVFVSGYNFDTFGQSRLDGNNVCYGTNWMGVSQSHAGFLKYIDGQNPGDTEITAAGSGIQIEFKPNSTQGDLNIINTCTGTPTITKVINVPTASYTNMSTFDSENGPNYMLRKTANGFDIGAAVINTTELPETVQANAYYFIYEM